MTLKERYHFSVRSRKIQEIYRKLWISADFENDATEKFFNMIQLFHSGQTYQIATDDIEKLYKFSERY